MAILTPPLLLVLALAIATGRLVVASNAVDQAAADAARAASISRTGPAALTAATQAADATLAAQGLQCSALTVSVDASGFAVPVGQAATVTVTVTCVVDLTDVAAPGLPGHLTEQSVHTSPLDVFRGRR
jgi:Flp pilus assembly protein TadG